MDEKLAGRAARRPPGEAAMPAHRVGASRPSRRPRSHELGSGNAPAPAPTPTPSEGYENDDELHAYAGFGIVALTLLVFVVMTLRL